MVLRCKAVSDKVIHVTLKINRKIKIKVIQVYAPTSISSDEDIEQFYEDLLKAKHKEAERFTVVIRDLNAKLGSKATTDPANIGNFGLGTRNEKEQMLLDFLNREQMFCINILQETSTKKVDLEKPRWKSEERD